jgi:hypothetical protein
MVVTMKNAITSSMVALFLSANIFLLLGLPTYGRALSWSQSIQNSI